MFVRESGWTAGLSVEADLRERSCQTAKLKTMVCKAWSVEKETPVAMHAEARVFGRVDMPNS